LEAKYYYLLATASEIWKETGWSAIIYLAAIAGIDPALYESAQVDGAGRLRRIWHITLPGIQGTVAILLILSVGSLFSGSFDQAMMLGNDMNRSRSEILDVFIYQTGLSKQRYSYAAAVGLFQSVISLILVILANAGSKKISAHHYFKGGKRHDSITTQAPHQKIGRRYYCGCSRPPCYLPSFGGHHLPLLVRYCSFFERRRRRPARRHLLLAPQVHLCQL
jgi:ABC-type Fe3+ transport system permease subunit